jgi:hypothetical protein
MLNQRPLIQLRKRTDERQEVKMQGDCWVDSHGRQMPWRVDAGRWKANF